MNHAVLSSFVDELVKIASNMAAPPGMKSGMGSNSMVATTPRVGIPSATKKNPEAKSTNYSIVHSEAPSAAVGGASITKTAPPPPVRT